MLLYFKLRLLPPDAGKHCRVLARRGSPAHAALPSPAPSHTSVPATPGGRHPTVRMRIPLGAHAVPGVYGRSFSESMASEACRNLDEAVEVYVTRLIEGGLPFLMLDATFSKARVNHRMVNRALMIAVDLGPTATGRCWRFGVYDSESNANWLDFVAGLGKRGLSGVRLVTSNAREGIPFAAEAFPRRAQARARRDEMVSDYAALVPKAMECLDLGFNDA